MTETKKVVEVGSGTFPIASVLTIVFVVLKLTHVINWAWIWVLSPLWISFGLSLAVLIIMLIVFGIIAIVGRNR